MQFFASHIMFENFSKNFKITQYHLNFLEFSYIKIKYKIPLKRNMSIYGYLILRISSNNPEKVQMFGSCCLKVTCTMCFVVYLVAAGQVTTTEGNNTLGDGPTLHKWLCCMKRINMNIQTKPDRKSFQSIIL